MNPNNAKMIGIKLSITLIAAVVLLPSFGHGLGYTTLGYSYITGDKEATGIRGIVDLSVL